MTGAPGAAYTDSVSLHRGWDRIWGFCSGAGGGGAGSGLGPNASCTRLVSARFRPCSGPPHGGGGATLHPPAPNIITWAQLQQLVHQNNESNFCDDLIDCIVFKESHVGGTLAAGFNASAVPVNYATGKLQSTERGLMQINQGAAAAVAGAAVGSPAATSLYNQLFNPAVNIQTGSAYLDIQVLQYHHGNLLEGLNGYGTGDGYGEGILNCVKQLQQGNAAGAFGAAIGK